jgi:DNA-binding transcriptional LysR family regulator
MITRKIADGRRIVVATPAYLQRHGTPKSPGELTNHEAIIYTRGGGQSWTFRKGAAEVPVVLQGRLKVTQAEGLREAVNHDMGLAVALEWVRICAPCNVSKKIELERGGESSLAR